MFPDKLLCLFGGILQSRIIGNDIRAVADPIDCPYDGLVRRCIKFSLFVSRPGTDDLGAVFFEKVNKNAAFYIRTAQRLGKSCQREDQATAKNNKQTGRSNKDRVFHTIKDMQQI
jgi:hypothetical protein